MDKEQFLDKYQALQTPANAELWAVLKLWLSESKSDDEIAAALGRNRSTATRKIGDICKHFGTDISGKKEQRQQLVLLFRRYCSDFEVHSSLYPDWIESNLTATKPANIVAEVVPITLIVSTSFDLLGRDADRQKLIELSQKHKLILLKAAAGIGKSTLARHFLETQFTKVIRLEMGLESGNVTPAEEKVSQILRKEFDEEPSRDFQTNLEILREKLSDKSRPIGVLIDNLEPALDANFRFLEKLRGYEDLLRILGDRDVCSFTLITSRRSLIVQRVKVHEYSLQGLDIAAWREYFYDCENAATSEDLEQMCVAYNGNAKAMDILHGAITNRFDGNITAYWNRYKDALLADAELETLISVEMDWLRDNQPDAYKLLCRMGCYRYQDVKTVPFEGLICLLWDVPESRKAYIVDYLSKSSLIEIKDEYYLHPAVREATKSRLIEAKDHKTSNKEIAHFLENKLLHSKIKDVQDALIGFEVIFHYLEAGDCERAASILLLKTENDEYDSEFFGYACWSLGFSKQVISTISKILKKVDDKINNPYILAQLYRIVGYSQNQLGNVHEAISSHNLSQQVSSFYFKTIEFDPRDINHFRMGNMMYACCVNVGLCYLELWDINSADKFFKEGSILAKIYLSKDNALTTINSCQALVKSILSISDHTLFNDAYSLVNDTYQKIRLRTFPVHIWSKIYVPFFLAKAFNILGDTDRSMEMYHAALSISLQRNYTQAKANILSGIGEVHRKSQTFDLALSHHHEAIEILDFLEAKSHLGEAYFQFGLTYQAMGEHDQAETYKAKALKLFGQMEAPKQIERVKQAFEQGAMK